MILTSDIDVAQNKRTASQRYVTTVLRPTFDIFHTLHYHENSAEKSLTYNIINIIIKIIVGYRVKTVAKILQEAIRASWHFSSGHHRKK